MQYWAWTIKSPGRNTGWSFDSFQQIVEPQVPRPSAWADDRLPGSSQTMAVFFCGEKAPCGPRSPHYRGFTITFRHTTLGRAPLYEWPARRKRLYLTTHNIHNRQTSMTPAVFDPVISPSDRPRSRGNGDRPLLVFVFLCSHRIRKGSCIPVKSMCSVILTPVPCIFYCFVQWTNQHTIRLCTYRADITTAST